MADPDAEARLLDGIVGKYGDGSDFGDLGNADEEALLEGYDDPEEIKHSTLYDDTEELDHEPEEPDSEDVLDLEAQDVELEDEEADRSNLNTSNAAAVSSTTQPEMEAKSLNQSELEERERNTDKFKNERQNPASKFYNIPDSLDEVPVPPPVRNNPNRNITRMGGGQMRGRGRGGNQRNNQMQHKSRPDNKTVLINPHFKGQVHINNDARLAWDARHRINHNKNQGGHQVGRVMPFSQNNRKQNEIMTTVQPWITNNSNNGLAQNVPQFQPPPPVYQPPPVFQPPPQVSTWNQYQPNSFNQVPPQMGANNNQHVFMQPLPPQNMFNNPTPPQFNQPPPQFTPPVFQNQNMNSQPPIFTNPQFVPPPNQFNPVEPAYHPGFTPNHPNPVFHQQPNNNFMPPPPQYNQPPNNRFVVGNQPNNQFKNQRFVRPKPNFNQGKAQFNQKMSPNKRKMDIIDLRKKKRSLSSTNLHEVPTVETPDTTMKEEKQHEDEDDETKAYRIKIEEQKKLRQQIWEQKELRRQQAAQQLKQTGNPSVVANPPNMQQQQQQQPPKQRQVPQRNLQVVRTNQPVRSVQNLQDLYPSTANNRPQVTRNVFAQQQNNNRNIKIINTDSDESNYDKQHLSSFLANRKILAKDQSLVDTSVVVISNLAAGTTDVKLRKMCQGIGDIKKLQMSPKERQATIQFNSVASAHAFFKKYQRTMLDLSMIQVALKPMP